MLGFSGNKKLYASRGIIIFSTKTVLKKFAGGPLVLLKVSDIEEV